VTESWRVVLVFEALCDLFASDSRSVKDFSAFYVMRKTKENGHFFAARSDLERMIVNLADSDHGWRETVIRDFVAWEAVAQKDRDVIPTAWNQGALHHDGISVTAEVQERIKRLLHIDFGHHNWSWLLDLSRPSVPSVVSKALSMARDDAGSAPTQPSWRKKVQRRVLPRTRRQALQSGAPNRSLCE